MAGGAPATCGTYHLQIDEVLDEVLLSELLRAPDGLSDEELRDVSRHLTLALVDRWTELAHSKGWIEPSYPGYRPRWYLTSRGRTRLDEIALRRIR